MRQAQAEGWRTYWPRLSWLFCKRFNRHIPITLGSGDVECYECGAPQANPQSGEGG